MFVAVCKNKLLTCAKRRILRFASNTAAQLSAFPSSNVCRGALASRWKDISTKTVRKEKSLLTIFKNSLCCLGQWPNQMHFPAERLRRQKSTFSIGLSGFWNAWSAPTLPSNLKTTKPDSFGQIRGRTDYYISHASSSLHSLSRAHLSPYVNCLFHFNVKSGISQGYRGYSSSSGKPDGKEVSAKQAVSTDSVVSPRSDSQSVANQGFHFKELYENPWTIPNFLCMARIALAPVLGYLIVEQYFHLSLALFTLAGATDLLDGYIARNWPNQKSVLGSALDPLADKILISVLYISLTYASLIPAPLTALVISRDVALIAAVFYVRYKTVPPPRTLSKYFNPCYATAQLKPTLISKVNTAVQLVLVAASLVAPVFHFTDSVLLQSLWFITALTTTASGYSYYHYGKKTVEVLNSSK